MSNFFLSRIKRDKEGYVVIYNHISKKMFGKILSWKEVEALDDEQIRRIHTELNKAIIFEKSQFDVDRLSHAIQFSTTQSSIGCDAMTAFTCLFCGEEEMWGSTAVPRICKSCARKMAENMIYSKMKIEKE